MLMVGEGASQFAKSQGVPTVSKEDLMTEKAINRLKTFQKFNPSVVAEFKERKDK